MALLRCKMCGGTLDIQEKETIAVCEYCGTKQTIPRIKDEEKANLYERANYLRINSEFDKAIEIYEKLLTIDTIDSEIYWLLVLCKYGVEYVEDPKTKRHIPTINRLQYTSIYSDENYRMALRYADNEQKDIYEEEAKEIDRVQKEILKISQKEEPFDVFICYKETDNNGRRTYDSVLGNELYHELTKEGYRVFFSRITLEEKLGIAYEPYIFAALNTSKVMVVIGTKKEYFEAVWVKNEWSRYLSLIKNGEQKILIPAYKDMNPYDLPEEFSHLQAQDMTKLGFMQDLTRAISKMIEREKPAEHIVVNTNNLGVEPLLKRIELFLEDEEIEQAKEYVERVLDIDPENAQAYLYKLMIDVKVTSKERLKELTESIESNPNYKKILRFGDKKLKEEIEGYNQKIKEKNFERKYQTAQRELTRANQKEDYKYVIEVLQEIEGYKDTRKIIEECEEEIRILEEQERQYQRGKSLITETYKKKRVEEYQEAIGIFENIIEYKDSKRQKEYCIQKIQSLEKQDKKTSKEKEKRGNKKPILIIATSIILIGVIIGIISITGKDSNKPSEEPNNQPVIPTPEEEKEPDNSTPKEEDYVDEDLTLSEDGTVLIKCKTNKTSITIPSCVTSIGNGAFYNCKSLESIAIPNSVTSIGGEAFIGCRNLTNIKIPNSVTSIGEWAFYYCTSLESIEIPNGVTSIGNGAFYNCKSLESIAIPNSVTSIGGEAFLGCTNLKEVIFEEGSQLASIPDSAFSNCTSLKNIEIPNSVKSIGESAFEYCTSLTSIVIPNSVTSIGFSTFEKCKSLKNIAIPNSVKSIGNKAFSNCTNLKEVIFEEGSQLASIQGSAFYNCTSLTSIVIPNNVTSIGNGAFENCTSLKEVIFEEGSQLASIQGSAFLNCKSLINIELPTSITSIGSSAFESCKSLESIEIPKNIISIQHSTFKTCTSLTNINVDTNNEKYKSIDGVLYTKDGTALERYPIGKEDTSFVIPKGVTTIGISAFEGCTSLTNIEIPNSVRIIQSFAFSYCTSLESIAIPNSVKSINNGTFYNCKSLTSIEIPNSVTIIQYSAFENCKQMGKVYIPISVVVIGWKAFYSIKDDAVIYCEASSEPSGWDKNWCSALQVVKWGYNIE